MSHNLAFCAAILLFIIGASQTSAGTSCPIPDGNNSIGECVPLSQCQPLEDLQKTGRRQDFEYLIKSQCDFKHGIAYVCCPPHKKDEPDGSTLPELGECGKMYTDRIFGGNTTTIGEHPWVALIEYEKSGHAKYGFYCGGSLINNWYVLTAAHCLHMSDSLWKPYRVRLGEWDTTTNPDREVHNGYVEEAPPHLDIEVGKIKAHQNYDADGGNLLNDIGLIRLARPVQYTTYIRPICLPMNPILRTKVLSKEKMEVVGWGRTETNYHSEKKLKAEVPVVRLSYCRRLYRSINRYLRNTQLCAGGIDGVDSCSGDSGGPIIGVDSSDKTDIHLYVAGITSFGPSPCGKKGWPGVYTRVSNYITWIQENLEP